MKAITGNDIIKAGCVLKMGHVTFWMIKAKKVKLDLNKKLCILEFKNDKDKLEMDRYLIQAEIILLHLTGQEITVMTEGCR